MYGQPIIAAVKHEIDYGPTQIQEQEEMDNEPEPNFLVPTAIVNTENNVESECTVDINNSSIDSAFEQDSGRIESESQSPIDTPAVVGEKRKRGRPKKNPDAAAVKQSSSLPKARRPSTSGGAESRKRGRGRPPASGVTKSKTSNEDEMQSESSDEEFRDDEEEIEEEDEIIEVTPRRSSPTRRSERIKSPVRQHSVVELSDSDEEENVRTSRSAVTAQKGKYGLRNRAARKSLKEDSESETEDEKPLKRIRKIDNPAPQVDLKVPSNKQKLVKEVSKIVKQLRKDSDLMDKYSDCFVDGVAIKRKKEEDELMEFFQLAGVAIERLTLNAWEWPSISSQSPFDLIKILSKWCRNISILNLIGYGEVNTEDVKELSLPNLTELYFTSDGMSDDHFVKCFEAIIKGAANISKIHYTYTTLKDDVDEINGVIKKLSEEGFLTNLKSLMFKPEADAQDEDLSEKQVADLAGMNLRNLEMLEFGNSLVDVNPSTFSKMLHHFSRSLRRLHIRGSFKIDSIEAAKTGFTVYVGMMDNLNYLSFGGTYEFQSIMQSRQASIINKTTTVVSAKDLDVARLYFRFPKLKSLKTLILGNLCTIDQLDFTNFPALETFRVGGPWNLGFDFLNSPPCLTIKELQFPDALKDPSLASVIPRVFPNVKKLWIFLPSCKALRAFFRAVQEQTFNVEELYLKTQFDFESTLEACLLGGRSAFALRTQQDIENMKTLRRYKYYEQFVTHYNIEVPDEEDDLDAANSPGISVLKSLKILQLEHIPRELRIPQGDYLWHDTRCEFTYKTIGFARYPLTQKCADELPLENLNFATWPNYEFMGRLSRFKDMGMTRFARSVKVDESDSESNSDHHSDSDYSPEKKTDKDKEKAYKVKVKPGSLRLAEFTKKEERK